MNERKRTIRRLFFRHKGFTKPSTSKVINFVGVASILLFICIQLATNAILTPLGKELQQINNEKNALIEENRVLEQEIAKSDSIKVINAYSEEKFDLKDDPKQDTIFVDNQSTQAILNR